MSISRNSRVIVGLSIDCQQSVFLSIWGKSGERLRREEIGTRLGQDRVWHARVDPDPTTTIMRSLSLHARTTVREKK